jgi:hypothetical protein
MIKRIGTVKLLILAVLGVLCVCLAFLSLHYLDAKLVNDTRTLNATQGQVTELSEKTERLKESADDFDKHIGTFLFMEKNGFFHQQNNRQQTGEIIDAALKQADLISYKYEIKSAETIKSPQLKEVGRKLISSEIHFTLEALDDVDFYKFFSLLQETMPGEVLVKEGAISKKRPVTPELLREIGTGKKVFIVEATGVFLWRTIVLDENSSYGSEGDEFISQDGMESF